MTNWIGFHNLKDIFADKNEFEYVKAIAEMFDAQTVTWEDK